MIYTRYIPGIYDVTHGISNDITYYNYILTFGLELECRSLCSNYLQFIANDDLATKNKTYNEQLYTPFLTKGPPPQLAWVTPFNGWELPELLRRSNRSHLFNNLQP